MLGYSVFSLSEWTLVLLEAGFDAVSILDFRRFDIQVVEKLEEDEEESGRIFQCQSAHLLGGLIRLED